MQYIRKSLGFAALLVVLNEPRAIPAPAPTQAQPPEQAGDAQSDAPAPAREDTSGASAPSAASTQPTSAAAGPAPDAERSVPAAENTATAAQGDTGEVIEIVDRYIPGSVQAVDAEELERFEHNDVHRVLGSVPGVYIREEDGYGLRPNIGMRGSGSNRSAKIALMEDGVLIAPAPYSAPAAYYFPLVTRMERVEVLKGPSSIRYGPNTVGGAVNLISKRMPRQRQAELDVAAGQHLYGKVHASYAERTEHVSFLVEGVKLRTDGFKELDTGGSTGFDKNDLQVKLRLNSDTASTIYHQLDVKLGYADEVSNETYTGLTDGDFAATPYRRYAATQLDRMTWNHIRMQLEHRVDFGSRFQLTTTVYRNDFSRDWAKLNGFNADRTLGEILANPDAGNNAVFYSVLTGESDSTSEAEMLLIGTNARDFVSQGVQITGHAERQLFGASHSVDVGVRYHHDQVDRFHFEEGYWMMSGELVRDDGPMVVTRDATGSSRALAAYAQDKLRVGRLTATAGLRSEMVQTSWEDRVHPDNNSRDSYLVLIPGAGVVYQALPSLGLLAGVHRGFVPVSPGQDPEIEPEASINYEAGMRYASLTASAEVIGFFSDYSNLKGTCSFSSGCLSEQVDDEFNGGQVHVLGVEALAATQLSLSPQLRIPLKASYTFNRSRFQTSFTSGNPQWGDVRAGDELPYLPAHQGSLQVGLGRVDRRGMAHLRWEVVLAGRFTSAMRDSAGQGETEPGAGTDAGVVFDLAASYDFGPWGKAYLTVDNLLDQAHIVSRRPFGARPGKPRLVMLGYKNRF